MKSPSKYQLQSVALVDFPTLCAVCCAFHFLSAIRHFIASIRTHTHTHSNGRQTFDNSVSNILLLCASFGEEKSRFGFFVWLNGFSQYIVCSCYSKILLVVVVALLFSIMLFYLSCLFNPPRFICT